MHETTALMFVHCLTATHPGSGAALGVVDLPVIRERHTNWPTIPGSSLKGVLRAASDRAGDTDWVRTAFGPDTDNASDHAGALSVSDARLLAFPVRSLKGVFAWTTCPAVLDRLRRDLAVARFPGSALPDGYNDVKGDEVRYRKAGPLLIEEAGMLLEEFDFRRTGDDPGVADWMADNVPPEADTGTADRLREHLAILSDDGFGHFVRHATEVSARIGLDYEKRTVRKGALFWEEHLPPETMFYALVTARDSHRRDARLKAPDILRQFGRKLPETVQVGGNATLGKGLCAVRLNPPPTEEAGVGQAGVGEAAR